MCKEELLKKLAECVVEMEDEEVVEVAEQYLEEGYSPYEGIMDGLVEGMNQASVLFDEEEYFVTDILLCADAMYAGIEVMKKNMGEDHIGNNKKVIIGVIEGDTHDIGKNLVKVMLETAGFEIMDLGRDVSPAQFVEKAKETKAELICISTLMTTTMNGMEEVIRLLTEEGIRNNVKVMIGGGPVSQRYAEKIGADGYSQNAVEAVKTAKKILNIA